MARLSRKTTVRARTALIESGPIMHASASKNFIPSGCRSSQWTAMPWCSLFICGEGVSQQQGAALARQAAISLQKKPDFPHYQRKDPNKDTSKNVYSLGRLRGAAFRGFLIAQTYSTRQSASNYFKQRLFDATRWGLCGTSMACAETIASIRRSQNAIAQ